MLGVFFEISKIALDSALEILTCIYFNRPI